MTRLVLGNDASWTGWGWCLATESGPLEVGHVSLGGRSWRWATLLEVLEDLDAHLVEATATLPPGELPRVVVEKAPAVYRGRGNQAATGQGLGQLSGAILIWGTRPGRLAYPWEITPGDWRPWWLERRGKRPTRHQWKTWAVRTVHLLGWGGLLEPYPWTGEDGGAQADVAEAVLIAVGAARNHRQAPIGPVRAAAWKRDA